jgi:hypothetical protein
VRGGSEKGGAVILYVDIKLIYGNIIKKPEQSAEYLSTEDQMI